MTDAAIDAVSPSSYDTCTIRASSSSEDSETFSRQSRHKSNFSDPFPGNSSSTSSKSVSPNGKQRRKSVFLEIGLDDFDEPARSTPSERPRPRRVRFRSKLDIHEPALVGEQEEAEEYWESDDAEEFPVPAMATTVPISPFPSMPRVFFLVFVLAFVLPTLNNSPWLGKGITPIGVKGGVIQPQVRTTPTVDGNFQKRDESATSYCKRWSGQSAVVNGTLYYYGGRMTTDSTQTSDEWNNQLVTLDLTKEWQISTPSLTGLSIPSGPPAVANGFLWNSYDSLYLYGGEFSDTPVAHPPAFSLWEYDIQSKQWSGHQNPTTSDGQDSDGGDQPVQRAAEGAGLNIPELGRGYYFGGHLDGYTTENWSQSTYRVYLKSMIEYTFPGYSNSEVSSLRGGKTASGDGVWRNITEGGLQDSAGFTERADGVLVYVPGFGKQGIILGLAGGTNVSFTQMNIIDVFDIANSTWYKQATSGTTPPIRVNPCAVAASAPDGSSTQIYMYGGQNLIPYGEQTQYDDMWILTVPSFTWVKVNTPNQSVPPGRAGHTCNLWNGQMVVVGGYIGQDQLCEIPGIYVFDASELTWNNQYRPLTGGNSLNQQAAQQKDSAALGGSFGYRVPKAVQSIIGGNDVGGATITAPIQSATDGPLATGNPVTYTVTQSNGAVVTETGTASTGGTSGSNGGSGSGSGSGGSGSSKGSNIAAIVAGVIAGCLAILAGYLAFCVWVYRRQLALYKNHVAMSQRAAAAGHPEKLGFSSLQTSTNTSSTPPNGVRVSGDRGSGPSSGGVSGVSHQHTNSTGSNAGLVTGAGALGANGYTSIPIGGNDNNSIANSSTDDLIAGQEPSFLGVMLNPRRSLRVINRD